MTKIVLREFGHNNDGETPTPGDWKTVPSLHGDNLLCVQVGDDESYTTGDMIAADAKIAASAPAALAACLAAGEYDRAIQEYSTGPQSQERADVLNLDALYDAWQYAALAALAKAGF
jgi:hypothetical protein